MGKEEETMDNAEKAEVFSAALNSVIVKEVNCNQILNTINFDKEIGERARRGK